MPVKCPSCQHEFDPDLGSRSGGYLLSFPVVTNETSDPNPKASENPNRAGARVRGPAKAYSDAFSVAWKAFPIGAEKFQAYAQWMIEARRIGGEMILLPLIVTALSWQVPLWERDPKSCPLPYFERYLKRRKWEDEQPRRLSVVPHRDDSNVRATDNYIQRLRSTSPMTAEQRAEIRQLAESKAVK